MATIDISSNLTLFVSGLIICGFGCYIIYFIAHVHRYLQFRNNRIKWIIEQEKKSLSRNKNKSKIRDNFVTTEKVMCREVFDKNMEYFRSACRAECGICMKYSNNQSLKYFRESFAFLSGPRAVLLQIFHPLIAIAGIEHSYVYKKSKTKSTSKKTNENKNNNNNNNNNNNKKNVSQTPHAPILAKEDCSRSNDTDEQDSNLGQCPFGFGKSDVSPPPPTANTSKSRGSGGDKKAPKLVRARSENSMTLAQENLKSDGGGNSDSNMCAAGQVWQQIDRQIASKALKLRFYRTFQFLFPICLGPFKRTEYYCNKVWNIHNKIYGTTNDGVYYSATMVKLLLWVWATLCDSQVLMSTILHLKFNLKTILCGDDNDNNNNNNDELLKQYLHIGNTMYDAYIRLGLAFGLAKEDMPKDFEEFEKYFYYYMCEENCKTSKENGNENEKEKEKEKDNIDGNDEKSKCEMYLCKEALLWARMFFGSNVAWLRWLHYSVRCFTGICFSPNIQDAFHNGDSSLMPHSKDRFGYCVGVLFLGISLALYRLIPLKFRILNSHLKLERRVFGDNVHSKLDRFIEKWTGKCGDLVIHGFLET